MTPVPTPALVLADIPNPIGIITDGLGTVSGWAFDKVAEGIANWILGAVEFFVNGSIDFLRTSSTPDPTAAWFSGTGSPYAAVRNVAALLLAGFVFLGIIQGLIRGDTGAMLRRVVGGLPAAVGGMVVTTTVVWYLLALTDAMSAGVLRTPTSGRSTSCRGSVPRSPRSPPASRPCCSASSPPSPGCCSGSS